MCEFGEKLPDGLHETIHKTVTTMVSAKKHVNVGGTKVYDMNIIYSRVIGLQASGRDFYIKEKGRCSVLRIVPSTNVYV